MSSDMGTAFPRGLKIKLTELKGHGPFDATVAFASDTGIAISFTRGWRFYPWHAVAAVDVDTK